MMPNLTVAEEKIMLKIWELKCATVNDILKTMVQPTPHSTVSSFIRILEKKGFLAHRSYGKTFEYYPLIAEFEYLEMRINTLLENYLSA
jgi:BlaI family transcriptional regulator, penicillinase repressor